MPHENNVENERKYAQALIAHDAQDYKLVISLCSELIDSKELERIDGYDELMVNVCALRRKVSLELFKQTGSADYDILTTEDFLRGRWYEKPEPGEIISYVTDASVEKKTKEKLKAQAKKYAVKGDEFSKSSRYEEALGAYSQAIIIYPECLRAYEGRVKINVTLGNKGAVLIDCAKITQLDPIDGKMILGLSLATLGEHDEADEVLSNLLRDKANKTNNMMITLSIRISKLFLTTEQLKKAHKYLVDAWGIDPACVMINSELGNLGRTYQLLGMKELKNQNYQQAKLYFDQATVCSVLVFKESFVDTLQRVGEIFIASKQYDIAAVYLDEAERIYSTRFHKMTPDEFDIIRSFGSNLSLADLSTLFDKPKLPKMACDQSELMVNSLFKPSTVQHETSRAENTIQPVKNDRL